MTGYYLGRVPAEPHAQQAQQTANTSQRQLANTQVQLGGATTAATQAAANLTRATPSFGFPGTADLGRTEQIRKVFEGFQKYLYRHAA